MANLSGKRRVDLVLDALRSAEWVSTAEICAVNVGGTEGTRRLRELRAKGYQIEQRRKPNSSQSEYRLVSDPQNVHDWKEPNDPEPNRRVPAVDGSRARRDALGGAPLPWIGWHGDTNRGFTAKHRGHSLAVRPFWGDKRWIYVTTKPDGKQESGTASDLIAAKRAAYEATL